MGLPTSIVYREEIEGFEEGYNESGPWAKKVYWIDWLDRAQFCRDLMGTASTTSVGGPWIRAIPAPYDDPSIGTTIYAKGISMRPEGNVVLNSTPAEFEFALVTVTFGALSWTAQSTDDPLFLASLSTDPTENESLQFATQELNFGTEWYEVPNSSIKWNSDGTKINTPLRRQYMVMDMVLTWHRYPVMPMSSIRNYADSVNDATFLGCDPGTVQFKGAKTVREMSSDGTITQKVQFHFKWRQFDWNKRVREDGFTWDKVVDSSSGNVLYTPRSYSGLLL